MYRFVFLFVVSAFIGGICAQENRAAVARLVSQNVSGSVNFVEVEGGVRVTGSIAGMAAGSYGFHVHELGDTSTCDAAGAHFNPHGNDHGGPDHDVRHVGDLGNVRFDANGLAQIDFVDTHLALRGVDNILGRTLVLHEAEDDLGQGGVEASLLTGNAGARVACGVIGITAPLEAWNSAASIKSSLALLPVAVALLMRL